MVWGRRKQRVPEDVEWLSLLAKAGLVVGRGAGEVNNRTSG